MNDVQSKIADECDRIKMLLLEKNQSYGNSALDPIRIFSSADPIEQIKVRIDDKLSRLKRGTNAFNEDTVTDLVGYLVLLLVAMDRSKPSLNCDDSGCYYQWSFAGERRVCDLNKDHEGPHRTSRGQEI